MAGSAMIEKILASHAGVDRVVPGDIVTVGVDMAVILDLNFYNGMWAEPDTVFDPDRIAVIYDHIVPAPNPAAAKYLARGRAFAERVGITRFHDVGGSQGICHQIIADEPYALPGQLLVCTDSHTCSGGALNCAARGIGSTELIYVLATGTTWFEVGQTVRYELASELAVDVSTKDVFLSLAGEYGDHVGMNIEFGGPGARALTMDQRRTLVTMCAEVSAEFAMFEPDDVLIEHLTSRGVHEFEGVRPDSDASYHATRTIDVGTIAPMIGLPGGVVHNTAPTEDLHGQGITHAFVGSCSNGTLADLRDVARILKGKKIHPGVNLMITPGSQQIYRQALREGTLEIISDAGGLVTTSSCGMCAGFVNALAAGDTCLTSSTRNFKGRMGSPEADIFLGSSASVAAGALAGHIIDPREVAVSQELSS